MKEVYKSRVYTDRPAYADFDAPGKFQAIESIVTGLSSMVKEVARQ